jgi:hypothetical protein
MTDQKRNMEYAPKGFEFGFQSVAAYRKLEGVTLPESFQFCRIQCMNGGIVLEGSATDVFRRGPRKGRTKWIGERTSVVIADGDADAEQSRYEQETGKCGACIGSGQVFKLWDHKTGTEYRTCNKCKGEGAAK